MYGDADEVGDIDVEEGEGCSCYEKDERDKVGRFAERMLVSAWMLAVYETDGGGGGVGIGVVVAIAAAIAVAHGGVVGRAVEREPSRE